MKAILGFLEARTYPDLDRAIKEAFNQVSLDDIKRFLLIAVTVPQLTEKCCGAKTHITGKCTMSNHLPGHLLTGI
jgi:hypothetical protein